MNQTIVIGPTTLAELIHRLTKNPALDAKKKRDLLSSINTFAMLMDRAAVDIAIDIPSLRASLLKIEPLRHGVSRKRFSNVKSDLARALVMTRALPRRAPKRVPSPEWAEFLAGATAQYQGWQLARFVRFCESAKFNPDDVDNEVLARFVNFLDATILTKSPREIAKTTAQIWNALAARSKRPVAKLVVPADRRFVARPLTDYPLSLQRDIETYIDRLAKPSLFVEDGPAKPLKPITIRNIIANLRQFLDALVSAGRAPEDFNALADLVRPSTFRSGLEQLYRRNGGKVPTGAQNIAATLTAIARHHVKLPADDLKQLTAAKARVTLPPVGMTAKNMARLGQFDDARQLATLVTLPDRLFSRIKSQPVTYRTALDAMHASALTILLHFPIRAANLAGLDLERHLTWRQRGTSRTLTIRIEGQEVKNGQAIEVDLKPAQSRLIWTYIQTYRPQLSTAPGTALFPARTGGPRPPDRLGRALGDMIKRETGLAMNAHLFRHLAGKIYLEARPGEYETVRRILGHRKIDTTLNFYTRFESKSALARYDEASLSRLRKGG